MTAWHRGMDHQDLYATTAGAREEPGRCQTEGQAALRATRRVVMRVVVAFAGM